MAKANKAAPAANTAAPAATTAAPAANTAVFTVLPPKRPLTGTKFGAGGNAATHQALYAAAQANGGTLTASAAQAVCKAQAHPGFYSYAVKRLQVLVPVVPAP